MNSMMVAVLGLVLFAQSDTFVSDPPIACTLCEEWNQPREPFKIFGETYYVGTEGLSSVLLASDDGHILIDGALPQSAALIDGNIRQLGFRTEDVRFILSSHAHFDHVGGVAALARASGATVVSSPEGAKAFRKGSAIEEDPQFGYADTDGFPPVDDVRVLRDGEVLKLDAQALTVHFTPGHTPGGTTWSWRSCEGDRCVDMVYADSLTAVSAPGFRFTGDETHPSIVDTFRASIAKVANLPCDIVIAAHPGFTNLFENLERRERGEGVDAFVDPNGCRAYAEGATRTLDKRIADEQ